MRAALRAASRCSREEILATLGRRKTTAKLPACDEITNEYVRHGWTEARGFEDFQGIHDRAVDVAIMFMDATGHRACSLVKSDKHEHTVLASQITVTYTDQRGQEKVVRGGSTEVSGIIPERAIAMSFTVLTSKPSGLSPTVYTFTLGDKRLRRLVRCG